MTPAELDKLFESFNYTKAKKSDNRARIYTLRYGMYHAAEIMVLDKDYDSTSIKEEYSKLGYATNVQTLSSLDDVEEYLFEGFFIKTPIGLELEKRYESFVRRQVQNLPEGSTYKYIQSAYDLMHQASDNSVIEQKSYNGVNDTPLIEKINSLLTDSEGSVFIIIEAAAGYGKTCTANEVLNTFSKQDTKQLPFFTELSRNREARVFKHILLNEVNEQFPNGVKQNIVIDQIIKGRIPLIIDGFDELISRESNKEEVESMLTTIVELLKGDAKIVITSRKTAIFNSEEFVNAVYESENDFAVARIEIKEPTIENWLNEERLELIEKAEFPIQQIANPVLLAYLRNIPLETLASYLDNAEEEPLVDKYIGYLLSREQTRQNLKLDNDNQLKIFLKLLRFMTEYGITAESKELIRDIIKSYNLDLLKSSLKQYVAEQRPSIDDLTDTLANHVFLDRRPSGNIGFTNDFIFGHLLSENLAEGLFQKYYPTNYSSIIPRDFARKGVQAFRIQPKKKQLALWDVFEQGDFRYDIDFFFDIDFLFQEKFCREYENLYIADRNFEEVRFEGAKAGFKQSSFSNVTFISCHFDVGIYSGVMFHNCNFYDCTFENAEGKEFNDFGLFACHSNNDFCEGLMSKLKDEVETDDETQQNGVTELDILSQFFSGGRMKAKAKLVKQLKPTSEDCSAKEFSRVFSSLRTDGYLALKEDVVFVTRQGITHYHQLAREE